MAGSPIMSFATTEVAVAAPTVKTPTTIKTAMSLDNILSDPVEALSSLESPGSPDSLLEPASKCNTPDAGTSSAQDDASPDDDMPEAPTDEQQGTADRDASDEQREFRCMNDEFSQCRTGQYTLNLSRKVISNHFGRNKACTRLIDDWPLFCRKHYQRATYNSELWQRRKVNLILRQFMNIEQKHPGMTYTVSLKKSEMDRLNTFARALDSGLGPQEAGARVAPNEDVKSFQAPIDVLRELQHHLGRGKSLAEVTQTMMDINKMLQDGDTKEIPSIEFLMETPASRSPKSPKSAAKSSPASARVSPKGAIKKPGRK